jgi:hypothetical protein
MGQLANDIHDAAAAHIPTVPVADPADLLTGPQLLAIFGTVETAIAALELLTRGTRWLRTPGVPSDDNDGENGDLAINVATTDVFAKDAGQWTLLFRLKADQGGGGYVFPADIPVSYAGGAGKYRQGQTIPAKGRDPYAVLYDIFNETSYTGTYTTTPADYTAQCGAGTSGESVTRTATATTQDAADAQAKANAIAAIVCQVFFGAYTTTPADYVAKCGAGTSGESVRRTGTGNTQAAADAQAKANALAAIVCPVPFPDYKTVLSRDVPTDPAGETTLTLSELYLRGVFKFNAAPGGDSTAKSMIVNIGGVFAFLVDFPATYTSTATGWTFEEGGHRYTGTFVDGTTEAILFD